MQAMGDLPKKLLTLLPPSIAMSGLDVDNRPVCGVRAAFYACRHVSSFAIFDLSLLEPCLRILPVRITGLHNRVALQVSINALFHSSRELRYGTYFTIRLFFTDSTPLTLRAISPALSTAF